MAPPDTQGGNNIPKFFLSLRCKHMEGTFSLWVLILAGLFFLDLGLGQLRTERETKDWLQAEAHVVGSAAHGRSVLSFCAQDGEYYRVEIHSSRFSGDYVDVLYPAEAPDQAILDPMQDSYHLPWCFILLFAVFVLPAPFLPWLETYAIAHGWKTHTPL